MPYLRYASWLYILLVECFLLRELGCVLGLLSFYGIFFFEYVEPILQRGPTEQSLKPAIK